MFDPLQLAAECGTLPSVLKLLEISPHTWRRWLRSEVPSWALRMLQHRAGYLDALGWKHWQIRQGRLYCNDLHHSYSWSAGELLADLVAPQKGVIMGATVDRSAVVELIQVNRPAKARRGPVGEVTAERERSTAEARKRRL